METEEYIFDLTWRSIHDSLGISVKEKLDKNINEFLYVFILVHFRRVVRRFRFDNMFLPVYREVILNFDEDRQHEF